MYCPHSVACSFSVYWPVVLTGSGLHCVATVLGVNSVVVGVELMSERHEAAMLMAERLQLVHSDEQWLIKENMLTWIKREKGEYSTHTCENRYRGRYPACGYRTL